jgi:hypothetical protein
MHPTTKYLLSRETKNMIFLFQTLAAISILKFSEELLKVFRVSQKRKDKRFKPFLLQRCRTNEAFIDVVFRFLLNDT